jgi:hypothetical protein
VRSNEDDRDRAIHLPQSPLQFNAAHTRQAHIENQGVGFLPVAKLEEGFRAGEFVDRVARRLQNAGERVTQGLIVIDDGNNADIWPSSRQFASSHSRVR